MGMSVCAEAAQVGFKLIDGDTGLTFSYTAEAGDNLELPTGIYLGIPDVGDVQIMLDVVMEGNIDELTMKFGFDLCMDVMGWDTCCSEVEPEACPLVFLDTTMAFGDYCDGPVPTADDGGADDGGADDSGDDGSYYYYYYYWSKKGKAANSKPKGKMAAHPKPKKE